MTKPVNLEEVVAELAKRVTALENKLGKVEKVAEKEDPNVLARMPREERRKRLGLSSLHEGLPDHRDEIKRDDIETPIEIIEVPIQKTNIEESNQNGDLS